MQVRASVLGLLVFIITAGSNAFAHDFFASEKFCAKANNLVPADSLINEVVGKVAQNHSQLVANGINQTNALAPVRIAFESLQPTEICASGVPLFYSEVSTAFEFLIVFRMKTAAGETRVLPVLYQVATVQARHGVGVNRWLGISRAEFEEHSLREAAKLEFTALPENVQSLDQVFSQTIGEVEVAQGTTSLIPVFGGEGDAVRYFLATQMQVVGKYYGARSLILKQVGKDWSVAPYTSGIWNFYMTVDGLRKKSNPGPDDHARAVRLAELSDRPDAISGGTEFRE